MTYTIYTDSEGRTILDVDGQLYVLARELGFDSKEGFYETRSATCPCCNQTHTKPPDGPFAQDVDELVALGWAMKEDDFDAWRGK